MTNYVTAEGLDPSLGWHLLTNDGDVGTQNISGRPLNTTNHVTYMHGASVSIEFFGRASYKQLEYPVVCN